MSDVLGASRDDGRSQRPRRHVRALIATAVSLGTVLFSAGTIFALPVAAHTGAIATVFDCQTGTNVEAHLDSNVAASATWTIKINGSVVDSGTGPGAKDLGPYVAGFGAGTATLEIVYKSEDNVYTISWKATSGCQSGSPTPPPQCTCHTASPTPSVEPTPTPTLEPTPSPTVEPTPTPTLEPTPSPTPTPTLELTPTPSLPNTEGSPTPSPSPSGTAEAATSTPTASPSGTAEATSGTPTASPTLPSTDIGPTSGGSGQGPLPLILAGLAGLALAVFLFRPAPARRR